MACNMGSYEVALATAMTASSSTIAGTFGTVVEPCHPAFRLADCFPFVLIQKIANSIICFKNL